MCFLYFCTTTTCVLQGMSSCINYSVLRWIEAFTTRPALKTFPSYLCCSGCSDFLVGRLLFQAEKAKTMEGKCGSCLLCHFLIASLPYFLFCNIICLSGFASVPHHVSSISVSVSSRNSSMTHKGR